MHLLAMYAGLDILPPQRPHFAISGKGDRSLISRPTDPHSTAGRVMWELYQQSIPEARGRISLSLKDLLDYLTLDMSGGLLRLGTGLGRAGCGAGILIFEDHSCLVVRTKDAAAWANPVDEGVLIEIVPIVLKLNSLMPRGPRTSISSHIEIEAGGWAQVRFDSHCYGDPAEDGLDLVEVQQTMGAELCWEATSWGRILPGLPALDVNGVWPAAFPRDAISADRKPQFEARIYDAGLLLLDQERDVLGSLRVRVFSGVPLQGSVDPARLIASFFDTSSHQVDEAERPRLLRRLEQLIFDPSLGYAADQLVGRREAAGAGRPDQGRGLICEQIVPTAPSNHDRLRIYEVFSRKI